MNDLSSAHGLQAQANTKRILGLIGAQGGSVSKEALKTINAINADSPVVGLRLAFIAKHALRDPQSELSEADRRVVESWL